MNNEKNKRPIKVEGVEEDNASSTGERVQEEPIQHKEFDEVKTRLVITVDILTKKTDVVSCKASISTSNENQPTLQGKLDEAASNENPGPNVKKEPNVASVSTKQNVVDNECPICFKELGKKYTSVTYCGHLFCTTCIKNCIKTFGECPVCRKDLDTKRIKPFFRNFSL